MAGRGGGTQSQLFQVDLRAPAEALTPIPVTGLGVGQTLRAIDYRPADGLLYGIATAAGVSDVSTTYALARRRPRRADPDRRRQRVAEPDWRHLHLVGQMGVPAETTAGFDIDPATGIGYAVLQSGGASRADSVDVGGLGKAPTALDSRVGASPTLFAAPALPPRPAIAFAPGGASAAEGEPATVTVTAPATCRWARRCATRCGRARPARRPASTPRRPPAS